MIPGGSERQGIPVSPGIAIGPAYVLRRERLVVPEHRIRDEQVDGEIERLRMAFAETRHRLDDIRLVRGNRLNFVIPAGVHAVHIEPELTDGELGRALDHLATFVEG